MMMMIIIIIVVVVIIITIIIIIIIIIIIMIIIINLRGLEFSCGNWRRIFSPLAGRLKCTQKQNEN